MVDSKHSHIVNKPSVSMVDSKHSHIVNKPSVSMVDSKHSHIVNKPSVSMVDSKHSHILNKPSVSLTHAGHTKFALSILNQTCHEKEPLLWSIFYLPGPFTYIVVFQILSLMFHFSSGVGPRNKVGQPARCHNDLRGFPCGVP